MMRSGKYSNQRRGNTGNKPRSYRKHSANAVVRFIFGVSAVLIIIGCSFGFGSFFSSAHGSAEEEPVEYKYYKSIEIQEGDTLWSIAERYMGSEYESVYDYMDELAEVNHIKASELDNLRKGDYLMITYYEQDYKDSNKN